MKFNHFNRRLHLYLALAMLPWFLMYAASALVFHHPTLKKALGRDEPARATRLAERPYAAKLAPDASDDEMRAYGRAMLGEADLDCAYGVWRRGADIDVYCHTLLSTTTVTVHGDRGTIEANDHLFAWNNFLGGLHERSGYQQDGLLDDLWAFVVDLACLGFIVWVASGLLMWWRIHRLRRWGAVALFGGVVTFLGLLLGL
jgi:hypothetical protein